MCEPSQSIIQIPQLHLPMFGGYDLKLAVEQLRPDGPITTVRGDDGNSYLHYYHAGMGHSRVLRHLCGMNQDAGCYYESNWWASNTERRFVVDYPNPIQRTDAANEAFGAAYEYAQQTCLGNMQKLRRFMEMSLRKSQTPQKYLTNLLTMMTEAGKAKFNQAAQKIFGRSKYHRHELWGNFPLFERAHQFSNKPVSTKELEQRIAFFMQWMRQGNRKLYRPFWADQDEMWSK